MYARNNDVEAFAELLFMPFNSFWYDNYNPISFSPISQGVDLLTNEVPDIAKHFVQVLNYFARPIDSLIITIAALCFEAYKHIHGIIKCSKTNRVAQAIVRAVFSPITLPLRLLGKGVLVLANRTVAGLIDMFIPYKIIADILNPQERAEKRMVTRNQEHPNFFPCPGGILSFSLLPKCYAFSKQANLKALVKFSDEKRFLLQTFWM